jgi:Tfp pilus assembly protein PilF
VHYINAIATLGIAYKRLGKKDEALKLFNQALNLAPNDQEIINNIGELLYEQEHYEKAAEQFLKALQIKVDGNIYSN